MTHTPLIRLVNTGGTIGMCAGDRGYRPDPGGLAGQLAAGPTNAFGVVKKLLLNSAYDSLESQMEHETRGIADCARTKDGQEGIAAFLEKRRPEFTGN